MKITKVKNSKLASVDFNNIPFGRTFSDHMFVAEYQDGKWQNARIEPYGSLLFDPACLALHYGQSIFEGLKAFVTQTNEAVFFRIDKHIERLNISAKRMCMPTVPATMFMDAVNTLVTLDRAWMPNKPGSSLYIRPLMFASDEFIGVRPSNRYTFVIMTGPTGPYYAKPVSLLASDQYVRAAQGGVGEAKTAGNYAASLLASKEAQLEGFDQIMWMDAKEFKYIQEVGTMNIFFVIDGKVVTPATDGAILKGITRKSVIDILKDKGYEVEERLLSIDEIVEAHKSGILQEAFGTGTAAVVSFISDITYKGYRMEMPKSEDCKVGLLAKSTIENIRFGIEEDKWNWVQKVVVPESIGA